MDHPADIVLKEKAEAEYLRQRAKRRADFFGWKWSDDQRTWWRFLWAWHYSCAFGLTVECHGADEDRPSRPYLHVMFLWRIVLIALPRYPLMWFMGGRKYGAEYGISNAFIQVFYGRRTWDSSTDQSKGYFPPWQTPRFHMHRYFALDGETVLREFPDRTPFNATWDYRESGELPKRSYALKDFDGEDVIATVYVEERQWKFGTGWCSWLSLFIPDTFRRCVDIDFSKETGRKKGSWKGGTVGHSIDLKPGEEVTTAMKRYCKEHDMTFVEILPQVYVKPVLPKTPTDPDLEPAKAP